MPRRGRFSNWLEAGVVLAALTVSAALFANGLVDLACLQLLTALGTGRANAEQPSPPVSTSVPNQSRGEAILARDAFELRTELPPERPRAPTELEPVDSNTACAIDLRLASVLFDVDHPERSMVSLRGPLPGSSSMFRPGMLVAEHILVDVYPRAVRFEHQGRTCWLRMFSANARDKIDVERKNARAVRAAARRRFNRPALFAEYPPPRALTALEFERGFREVEPTSFSIDRRLLLQAMSHWDWVAATTRLRASGLRFGGSQLIALRPSGLLESLGLRRGDMLWTANGQVINDIEALKRAISGLAEPGRMTLIVERKAQRLSYDYESH